MENGNYKDTNRNWECNYIEDRHFLSIKINYPELNNVDNILLFNTRDEYIDCLSELDSKGDLHRWMFQGYVNDRLITEELILKILLDEGEICKKLEVSIKKGKYTFRNVESILIICRPFLPNKAMREFDSNFYFADENYIDMLSLREICKAYSLIYIERSLAEHIGDDMNFFEGKITVIDDFTQEKINEEIDVRIAFLASSDTHVNFMLTLAKEIPNHLFIIPDKSCKDDSAAAALDSAGVKYVEVHYNATKCDELLKFAPQYIFCAADWTSEFIAVQRIIKDANIVTIALQEGPQDWHTKFYQKTDGKEVLKVLNHYRNADIFFAQGVRTLEFIRPKYFAITGNNKIDHIEQHPLPAKPKVLINCNFTYVATKPLYESKGDVWLDSVLRVCRELGIDYIISKHPRDLSELDDPRLVKSNAYKIKDQLLDCSISISRFSSIPYETLSYTRKAIYYNNHLEPMPTFTEDIEGEVQVITGEKELRVALEEHISNYPCELDYDKINKYLHKHVGPQDGKAVERIISMLQGLGKYTAEANDIIDIIGESYQIESLGEKKRIAVFMGNTATNYSGGRYHGLMLTEALSTMGHKVYLVTNNYPVFYSDFTKIKSHQKVEVILTNTFKDILTRETIDFIFCIPGMDKHADFYNNIVAMSKEKNALLVLLNFESPNWFNTYSPYKKSEKNWSYWEYISENADVILSSAKESVRFAKEYYGKINRELSYEFAYPSINTIVCDSVPERKKEKRIIIITRYNGSQHKGTYNITSILSEKMRGYTLVLIIGTGEVPNDMNDLLEEKCNRFGIGLEIKRKISDYEKFTELKRACILLFPSYFEGYGYPPIESLYCNMECIAFELPVLRETCAENVTFVPLGDFQRFKEALNHVIDKIEKYGITEYQELIRDKASFESFAIKLDMIVQKYKEKIQIVNQKDLAISNGSDLNGTIDQKWHKNVIRRCTIKIAKSIMSREMYEKYRGIYNRLGGK